MFKRNHSSFNNGKLVTLEKKIEQNKNKILEIVPNANVVEHIVGPIVAAHCGPKMVAISYNKK